MKLNKKGGAKMDEGLLQLRDGLRVAGCGPEEIALAERLFQAGRFAELKTALRRRRCALLEQLHDCGKRIDRMDFLIRQTEQYIR